MNLQRASRASLLVFSALLAVLLSCGDAEECSSDEDCSAGSYCRTSGCGGEGTCLQALGKGEPCDLQGRRCGEGLVCHDAFEPPQCRPPSKEGGRCWDGYDCASSELVCNVVEGLPESGTCIPAGSLGDGEPCAFSRSCVAGLACRPGRDGITICLGPGEQGDPCERQPNGDEVDPCGEGLYCPLGSGQTCLPMQGEGDACTTSVFCEGALVCKMGSRRCEPASGPGEGCLEFRDCDAALACLDGSCVARSLLGEPCEVDWNCEPGDVCVGGVCEARRLLGETCERDGHCLSGTCSGGLCGRGFRLLGEPCADSEHCSNGVCKDGVCQLGRHGDRCDYLGYECDPGFYCDQQTCERRKRSGEPCDWPDECESLYCDRLAEQPRCE